MTHLSNGTTATDIDATTTNAVLSVQGYTIHHIEDCPGHGSIITGIVRTTSPKRNSPSYTPRQGG